jgi:hypothetical protein
MAAKTMPVKHRSKLDEVISKSPVPIVYTFEHFPRLTVNQLLVLNFLEHEAEADKPMSRTKFAQHLGWHIQQVSRTERTAKLVEARKSLYIGKGIQLGRAIPGVMSARIKAAKSDKRGANQASRIVLETAGVLGPQAGKGVSIQFNADKLHLSFDKTMNVFTGSDGEDQEVQPDV